MSMVNELKSLSVGDVFDDNASLTSASCDASLFEVRPQAIVAPRSEAEVAKLVRTVAERKSVDPALSLTARAAGTGMDGGALTESIVVDVTKYLHTIGELRQIDGEWRIDVEPGVYYRDLEKVLTPKGLMLPSYTASKDTCTVGGMVANNAGGEYSLQYGNTNRYVRKARLVLDDGTIMETHSLTTGELDAACTQKNREGEIYTKLRALIETYKTDIIAARPKVAKNSSGYFLWDVWDGERFDIGKIIVGSQGTLGIMTRIELAVVPLPQHEQALIITLGTLDALPEVVLALRAENASRIEAFDENTYALAAQHMPEATRGVVTTTETSLTIIATFSGDDEPSVAARCARAHAEVVALAPTTCSIVGEEECSDYWHIRRASFTLLREHAHGEHRVAPFIDDIVVPPEKLAAFLPELRALMAEYFLTYTIAGHVGDGNFHLIPLVDMRDEHERHRVLELADRVFSLVFSYGGVMAGEHNDGLIRTPFVERMFGHAMNELFKEVKHIFDPQNIFNPGKKVNGSLAYALEHFATKNNGKV